MNDTKWRELCFAFSSCEKKPAWRTLDFLSGYLSKWDCEWFHHVGPDYCTIEWLEIDPKDCPETQVRDLLDTVGVPFEHAEYFKVFGYKQSGNSSKLQK
jgi:hypothetical protein